MLAPLSSGSRTTAKEHEDGMDNLSRHDLEEHHDSNGVRGEDTGTGREVVGQEIVPLPSTRIEGA